MSMISSRSVQPNVSGWDWSLRRHCLHDKRRKRFLGAYRELSTGLRDLLHCRRRGLRSNADATADRGFRYGRDLDARNHATLPACTLPSDGDRRVVHRYPAMVPVVFPGHAFDHFGIRGMEAAPFVVPSRRVVRWTVTSGRGWIMNRIGSGPKVCFRLKGRASAVRDRTCSPILHSIQRRPEVDVHRGEGSFPLLP